MTDQEQLLLENLERMHQVADTLMAALIEKDPEFRPSKSGLLPAFRASKNAIDHVKRKA